MFGYSGSKTCLHKLSFYRTQGPFISRLEQENLSLVQEHTWRNFTQTTLKGTRHQDDCVFSEVLIWACTFLATQAYQHIL